MKPTKEEIRKVTSNAGKRSWQTFTERYSPEEQKRIMTEMGKKGGYPKGRPRKPLTK